MAVALLSCKLNIVLKFLPIWNPIAIVVAVVVAVIAVAFIVVVAAACVVVVLKATTEYPDNLLTG